MALFCIFVQVQASEETFFNFLIFVKSGIPFHSNYFNIVQWS